MPNSGQAVALLIDALEQCGVEYMIVGAFSVNPYGIERSTNDADLVVQWRDHQLGEVRRRLPADFRFDPQMQMEAFTGSIRNTVTYLPTGFQLELFRYNANDEHHVERFRRRRRVRLDELQRDVWIPTAEDVVIQKLRWQRQKDLDDVLGILAVSGDRLDWTYLSFWTRQHGTEQRLLQLKASLPDLNDLA